MTPSETGRVCFVIMPFDARLNRVWDDATEPAVKSAGFDCVRGDGSPGKSGPIMEFVIQQIFSADAIVADLTFSNPNVFYELGIAHAIADKTIMICAKGARDLPFDVAAYRTILYDKKDLGDLRTQLEQALRALRQESGSPSSTSNPVRQFGPSPSFSVPYRKEGVRHALREILSSAPGVVAAPSVEVLNGRRFERQADSTVLQLISQYTGPLARIDAAALNLMSPDRDILVTGSPRFNPIAERIQQAFDLPCQYVSARASADAGSRDESPVLTPAQRTLRIVTTYGDELSASIDNGIGGDGPGTDYGLIVLASLPGGRRIIWLSGIHGTGTLGAYRCLLAYADRLLAAVTRTSHQPNTAVTQLVRVKYSATSSEYGLDHIDGELLGDPVVSTATTRPAGRRAVLFDLGDVVMKFDRDRTYRSISHLQRIDYRDVRAKVRTEDARTRLVADYEVGATSTEAFCDRLSALFGGGERLRERLPEFWGDIFWPNYEMFEVLLFLKKQDVALGLVSNTNPLHLEQVKNDYPEIMRLFDSESLSYEVKSAKPDAPIFNDAIEKMRRLGVEPRNMLYVDDLERHVAQMRALGVTGFVYRSHSHLVLWLRKQGIYVPTITDADIPATR